MIRFKKAVTTTFMALSVFYPFSLAGAEETMVPKQSMPMEMQASMNKMDMNKMDMGKMDMEKWVPLREKAEQMGFDVMWNQSDKSIMLTLKKEMGQDMNTMKNPMEKWTKLVVMIHSKNIMVDNQKQMLDYAPYIKEGRTYVKQDFIQRFLNVMNK